MYMAHCQYWINTQTYNADSITHMHTHTFVHFYIQFSYLNAGQGIL